MAGEKKAPFSKPGIEALARTLSPLFAVALMSCAGAPTTAVQRTAPASALQLLDVEFQHTYEAASIQTYETLRADVPLIVNDFLNMTLYLPSRRDSVRRFRMDNAVYFVMARVSHVPTAIYAAIAPYGYGALGADQLRWLQGYEDLLASAYGEVEGFTRWDRATKSRLLAILGTSLTFVRELVARRSASEKEVRDYTQRLMPLIRKNLVVGADEQLRQFRNQTTRWRRDFPNERWHDLRVVVEGFHQPRSLYSQKLFFQWLLREPGLEDKVVYAEFQFSPFGAQHDEAETLALRLLTNVYLDKGIAFATLADSTALQRDVMGPAADSIIRSWRARNQR